MIKDILEEKKGFTWNNPPGSEHPEYQDKLKTTW